MIAGPIPLSVIARFLGKQPDDMRSLIDEDGLPTLAVNGARRPVYKVYFLPFLAWINDRATGRPMTADELEAELERCLRAHNDPAAKTHRKKV